MNPNSFSIIGYLSIVLWLSVPVFWWFSRRLKANSWICPGALAVALLALVCAKINSSTHVDRIAPDPAATVDKQKAMEEAKRKAMEESRGEDVADIRFAEDGADDFLDVAGMDESDLKYMKSLEGDSEPEWKKSKKSRGEGDSDEGSLESRLGGKGAIEGVKSDDFAEKGKPSPILMTDAHMAMAHRLDGYNQTAAKFLIGLALLAWILDYLARSNVYALAYAPLPLPGNLRNLIEPHAPVVDRRVTPRRSMVDELRWISRQGDCFLLLTTDASRSAEIASSMPRCDKTKLIRPMDVIHVSKSPVSDDFIFDALWFGTCSVVVDSPERAQLLINQILTRLAERKLARAHTKQTAHIVWDLDSPPDPDTIHRFERLASATGFSLMLCR